MRTATGPNNVFFCVAGTMTKCPLLMWPISRDSIIIIYHHFIVAASCPTGGYMDWWRWWWWWSFLLIHNWHIPAVCRKVAAIVVILYSLISCSFEWLIRLMGLTSALGILWLVCFFWINILTVILSKWWGGSTEFHHQSVLVHSVLFVFFC